MKKLNYPLENLERLLTVELSPESLFPAGLTEQDGLIKSISTEKEKVLLSIKEHVFSMKDEQHCAALVRKYYNELVLLIDRTYQTTKHPNLTDSSNLSVVEYMQVVLEDILRFVELHFTTYLNAEVRMTQPELAIVKLELIGRSDAIPGVLLQKQNSQLLIDIVMIAIFAFIDRIEKQEAITLKEVKYFKGFTSDLLEGSSERYPLLEDCPSLHEIILYWNFNSRAAITYLAKELEGLIHSLPTTTEKLNFIRFQFMRLLHLPARPRTLYNVELPSLKSHFTSLMTTQKEYYEGLLVDDVQTQPPAMVHEEINEPGSTPKHNRREINIQVDMSVDQLGLFFRAADHTGVIKTRSLSALMRVVAPSLSTKYVEEVNWRTIRAKAYHTEWRDVQAVGNICDQIKAAAFSLNA